MSQLEFFLPKLVQIFVEINQNPTSVNKIYILWWQGQNETFNLKPPKSYRCPKIKIHGFGSR